MKKITNYFFALVAALIIVSGASYASFPVKNDKKDAQVVEQKSTSSNVPSADLKKETNISNPIKKSNSESSPMDNEKLVTLLLWFFLGGLAAHRWYRGKPVGWNILFILTAGGCGVWAIVDLVNILTDNF